jgi:hypothetical protein
MKLSKLQQAQEIITCMFEQDRIPKRVKDNWENPMFPVGYGLNNAKERIWLIEEASRIVKRDLFVKGKHPVTEGKK